MKSTTILIAAILMATTVQAQSKNNWDSIISKAKKATDLHFATGGQSKEAARMIGTDTLQIGETIKVVKIGDKAIPTELLKKAMLILSQEDVSQFINGIQEYPAKIDNPFTQYFIKFFNLQVQEPKKQ